MNTSTAPQFNHPSVREDHKTPRIYGAVWGYIRARAATKKTICWSDLEPPLTHTQAIANLNGMKKKGYLSVVNMHIPGSRSKTVTTYQLAQ